jgi:hypothetical protein
MRGFLFVALGGAIAVSACSSSTGPTGPCADQERTAELLYGPPLQVTTSGDTTTYVFAASKIYFIAQGNSCVEKYQNGGG